MLKDKTLPCPIPSESTATVPPHYSTIFLTMWKLKPAPLSDVLVLPIESSLDFDELLDLSLNSSCSCFRLNPTPVSQMFTMSLERSTS